MQKIALIIYSLAISILLLISGFGLNSISQAVLTPTDNVSLTKIQNLIDRGKIVAPRDGEYGLVNSIKNKKLTTTTIDLIILLANQFDSIEIASIYRPYVGGWPAHSNGEAIDLTSVTYEGKNYPHIQAIRSDNQIATGVWVYVANILKQSRSVILVITALDLADKYSTIPGFIRQDITGNIDSISVLTTPTGGNATERHEDHMHIEVSPIQKVVTKIEEVLPKTNGQGMSPSISQGVSNPSQYTINPDCKNSLGRNYIFGTTSDLVKQLQNCLTILGLFSFPAGSTGYYGNVTTASYNQWLAKTDVCPVLKLAIWSAGERSPRVEALQRCLRQANLFDYPSITGFYGPITTNGYNRWVKS